jgi:hypothetical protein
MAEAGSASERDGSTPAQASWLTVGVRYVLPGLVVLGGLVVMAFGSEADLEGGAGIVSAGLAVYAMSWLYRASIDGDRVRDEEEAARTYFDEHGRWPDEVAPAQAGAPTTRAQESSLPRPDAQAPSATAAARRSHTALRPRRPGA